MQQTNSIGLTKENFWNRIEGKYPLAFKHFNQWIDKYKKEVNWDRLFSNGQYYLEPDNSGGHRIDIKFHDLPFDMQSGVLLKYCLENSGFTKNYHFQRILRFGNIDNFKEDLENIFQIIETDIKTSL